MSINRIIINEFSRLIKFKQSEKTDNVFRLKQLYNILKIITDYEYELTESNIDTFAKKPGIGKSTITRIKEILENGKLKELCEYTEVIDKNEELIKEFETIVGVGRSTALKFIEDKITSVKDLKQKIKSNKYQVNDKIKIGIKYYNKFEDNIPRKEINSVNKLLKSIVKKMNENEKKNEKYIFEICGSYRRALPFSGDIDILLSKLNTNTDDEKQNHLKKFVKILKEPHIDNNNEPLLIDDITNKDYKTKYMGFSKYNTNPFRRIDIRYVSHDVYYPTLLYFTGSAKLNINMRKIAENMGLKLSEYGLTKTDGSKLLITSEEDIFKILKIEYLPPKLRDL